MHHYLRVLLSIEHSMGLARSCRKFVRGDFAFALKGIRTFVDACGCKFMIRFTILGELEIYFRLGTSCLGFSVHRTR